MAGLLIDIDSACVHCVAVKLRLTLGVNAHELGDRHNNSQYTQRVSTFQVSAHDGLIIDCGVNITSYYRFVAA